MDVSLPASMKKIRSKMKALDLAQNLMQPFPHPNDGSDKISLRLANWLQRYSSLRMFTDARTDAVSTSIL